MGCSESRVIFANSGGIGYLSRHLRNGTKGARGGATVQQLYELTFCIWALTYECKNSATIRATFARDNAVVSLVDLVCSAPREKVVRVALSALRILAQCTPDGVPGSATKKVVNGSTFLNDIVDDLDVLYKLLHANFKEMSRWDVYLAEVESGSLEWGFLHAEKFFKENAKKFEGADGDFFVVKV